MKASDVRKKTRQELEQQVHDLRKKLSDIRFTVASNRAKNTNEKGDIKRDIARILTVLRESKP